MPRYSFQLRTDDVVAARPIAIEFRDLDQAIDVALLCMVERAVLDVDATLRLADSIVEIVGEDGQIVASLPIAGVLTRH